MKRITILILSLFLINPGVYCQEAVIENGTEVHFKSKMPVELSNLFVGKKVPFILSRDIRVGDTVVIHSGTEFQGEVVTGDGQFLLGVPESLFIQFNNVCEGAVCLPLMQAKSWRGSNRVGWAAGLALPTLCFSLFIVGGKIKNVDKQDVVLKTVGPVVVKI